MHKKVAELAKKIDEVNPKGETTTTDIFFHHLFKSNYESIVVCLFVDTSDYCFCNIPGMEETYQWRRCFLY